MANPTNSKSTRPPSKSSKREVEARRSKRNARLTAAAIALAVGGLLWFVLTPKGGSTAGTSPAGTVTIARSSGPLLAAGDPIPEFKAPMMGGGTMTWSDYAGKPSVLIIWASWCPHCQKELPILASTQAKYPGVQLVSVTTWIGLRSGPTPQEYMTSKGLSFPVGVDDANTTIMKGLGVPGVPTVFYVGSDNKVVQVTQGEVDPALIDQYFAALH